MYACICYERENDNFIFMLGSEIHPLIAVYLGMIAGDGEAVRAPDSARLACSEGAPRSFAREGERKGLARRCVCVCMSRGSGPRFLAPADWPA